MPTLILEVSRMAFILDGNSCKRGRVWTGSGFSDCLSELLEHFLEFSEQRGGSGNGWIPNAKAT